MFTLLLLTSYLDRIPSEASLAFLQFSFVWTVTTTTTTTTTDRQVSQTTTTTTTIHPCVSKVMNPSPNHSCSPLESPPGPAASCWREFKWTHWALGRCAAERERNNNNNHNNYNYNNILVTLQSVEKCTTLLFSEGEVWVGCIDCMVGCRLQQVRLVGPLTSAGRGWLLVMYLFIYLFIHLFIYSFIFITCLITSDRTCRLRRTKYTRAEVQVRHRWLNLMQDRPMVVVLKVAGRRHLLVIYCIGGSVVEFSPATREARVRFPANATMFFVVFGICCSFWWGLVNHIGAHEGPCVMLFCYFITEFSIPFLG